MADWTTLDELPAGTLFETEGGTVALKTEYSTTRRSMSDNRRWLEPECYIVGSGERYYAPGGADPTCVAVRPINMPPSPELSRMLTEEYPSLLNRPCTLAVTAGSSRFGTVVSQDDRGIWFRGKMERDNPKERERMYFVPWSSVVWMEMEES